MSSRDIGPALPPHMRKNQRYSNEDSSSSSRNYFDGDRREVRRDRDGQRDKYGDRVRDKDRERRKADRPRNWDRSSRSLTERDTTKEKERREGTRKSSGIRERNERNMVTESAKRSKRSKTDRTYNTDTEESSDENSDVKKWPGNVDDSDLSDDDEGALTLDNNQPLKRYCTTDTHSTQELKKLGHQETEDIKEASLNLLGPSLPPHMVGAPSPETECQSTGLSRTGGTPSVFSEQARSKPISAPDIGPALPPRMQNKSHHGSEADLTVVQEAPSAEGYFVGPSLPPHLLKVQESGMHSKDGQSIIGPSLPPDMINPSHSSLGTVSEDESDDEIVGPLLPEQLAKKGKNYMVQAQLEHNAAVMKRKLENKDKGDSSIKQREEWMLELPPEGTVDLGLGPRTFRARGAPEKGADRSAWTDTPADKARKEEEAKRRFELGITSTAEVKQKAESKELSRKDESMEAIVKKHKRSKESLLEAHQKKLQEEKKKKEKSGKKQERRPFNRDIDLKTNVFDDSQKKAIFKKAQFLDSRFSSGESKYL